MIETFGNHMTKRFAAESGLQYSIDEDDDVRLGFSQAGTVSDGGALTVWISCCAEDVLHVQGVLASSDGERADLLEWCNTWNLQHPWPTLKLAEAPRGSDKPVVAASVAFPVGSETTYETVECLCNVGLGAVHAAWLSFGNWAVDTRFREITNNIEDLPPTADGPQP